MLLLPHTPVDGARLLAERIREHVAGHPVDTDAGRIRCTLSLGVTGTEGRRGFQARELLADADHALYEAKRGGRNRVCVSSCGLEVSENLRPSLPTTT